MKRLYFVLAICAAFTITATAARRKSVPIKHKVVSQTEMQKIYDNAKTPYKYGLVVAPQDNGHKIDCPTVFSKDGKWFMTYVCYNGKGGTDGRGYETWLATSDDLLHWTTLGRILEYAEDGWDKNQRGGFPSLVDWNWGGSYNIEKYKGHYWMTYIGGEGTGYEAVNAPLSIGLAATRGDVTTAHPWETFNKPVLSYKDKNSQWWEQMTQYKSNVYRIDKKLFGYQFMMYYNAGGKNATHPKGERIGVAFSNDMKKWTRYSGNPIFAHDTDGTITGDAQIVKMDNVYVMFYFSAFNPTREYYAYNTFAASYDLIHWNDWQGADLIVPSKSYDEMFAHKSYVVKHNGVVYHFYCAVNNSGQRGIAVATSVPMGMSEVNFPTPEPVGKRLTQSLDAQWQVTFNGETFTKDVPFNLDDYYGALQKEHGNLHGKAVFKKSFLAPDIDGKEYFLRFEGVGTYCDILLNGKKLGSYDIGRTTETIDITANVLKGKENRLEVRTSHPKGITDMPWVCGGCSSEWGFSEGSQPFGIFRPVELEITDKVRIEPFGVHVWSNQATDSVFVDTELKNYDSKPVTVSLVNKLSESAGKQVVRLTDDVTLLPGETKTIRQQAAIANPKLWSIEKPYLYNLNTMVKREGKATDDLLTPFGFRTISWPLTRNDGDKRFYINGKPQYINGTCEYEHLFGQSHAFSKQQIEARIKEVRSAGFNAFRDAHQPHNLYYKQLIDKEGLLWWPQFSAHIWYDTPQFKESFKRHLVKWVKERRNSPSIILWGLQNESTIPVEFAHECSELIRSLDPTCGSQRLITTCNGGEGTDWNVVQNWSGTYGGKLEDYAQELSRPDQLLNGEYGAWRTLGNHSGERYTEEKQCDILERKVQLAESVKDSVCGQFLWTLQSHDNPGRRQPEEGYRLVDKVGPFNHKGLFTTWEQPTDAYYMYKSHYINASAEPMVYIVPGIHSDSIRVYSNCEKVTLSCGDWAQTQQKPAGNTTLFLFRNVPLDKGHALIAKAWNGGKVATADSLALSSYNAWDEQILKPENGYNYIARINCGGDDYTDSYGLTWNQDNTNWSTSWADKFKKETNPYQASQTYNPTLFASPLFHTSRFGRHLLSYSIPAAPGDYRIELYFIEPWYGRGASPVTDCEGLRLFDVAVNDSVYIRNLDLWGQARFGRPYKRVVNVHNTNGEIRINFPRVNAGQAIISAIAVATKDADMKPVVLKPSKESKTMWADFEKEKYTTTPDSLLPPKTNSAITADGIPGKGSIVFEYNVGVAKVYALRFRYYNPEKERMLHVKITDLNGVVYKEDDVTFVKTPEKKTKRRNTSITTGSQTNAGSYKVKVTGEGIDKMIFDKLTIE